jgi:integrase
LSSKLVKADTDIPLYLDTASGIYVYRPRVHGKQRWISTKQRTLGAAKREAKLILERLVGDQKKPGPRRLFADAFDAVIAIQDAKADKTAVSARLQIDKHLRPWFKANCQFLDQFDEETWAQYRKDQAVKSPGRKLEHDRRHLLMALGLAQRKGWLKRKFTRRELFLKEASEPIGRALSPDEVKKVREAAQALPRVGDTLLLQIDMALFMGMRLREILHLGWDEVEFASRVVRIRGQRVKTRYSREVPIDPLVFDRLERREEEMDRESLFVFPAPGRKSVPVDSNKTAWRQALKDAGVKCRFHDLRHTYISTALLGGMPEAAVAKFTGASRAVIQRVYLHLGVGDFAKASGVVSGILVGQNKRPQKRGGKR